MNEFEKAVASYIGEEKLKRIQKVKVGIAGAGGLGSNCAFNLVRSGFKKFKIVDFDVLEYSNLNRQFYFFDQINMYKVDALKTNLTRINSDIDMDVVRLKITLDNAEDIFSDCDVVVEAFDKAEYKSIIVENYYKSGKLLVAGSGLAGWGCSDDIKVNKVHSMFYIVGDMISEVSLKCPPISPRVNVAAAKQADIVLEWAINNFK